MRSPLAKTELQMLWLCNVLQLLSFCMAPQLNLKEQLFILLVYENVTNCYLNSDKWVQAFSYLYILLIKVVKVAEIVASGDFIHKFDNLIRLDANLTPSAVRMSIFCVLK